MSDAIDILNQQIVLVRLSPVLPSPLGLQVKDDQGRTVYREPSRAAKIKSVVLRHILSIATILALVLSSVYFFGFAKDRYESEATFVIRGQAANSMSAFTDLMPGIMSSADDAHIVRAYMLSRDAMTVLIAKNNLLDVFGRAGMDFLWWPRLFGKASGERLYSHYSRFVAIVYDKASSISTLKVQAFSPEDAQRVAAALLSRSEEIVNQLNERAQSDAIAVAGKEVQASRQRALDAQQNVTDFRNRESVIDPTIMSTAVVETVARLSLELAQTNAMIAELAKSSPGSPQISNLRLRVTALDDQISKEKLQLAGTNSSLAPRIAEYERLILERELAERAFSSALASHESAIVDAQRKRTFLEQIARPNLPDYPKFPYRMIWLIVITVSAYSLAWMIKRLAQISIGHVRD